MLNRDCEILLVEDNEGDIVLTQEIIADLEIPVNLSVARSGEEALEFLSNAGPEKTTPLPDLILLDLNMPRVSGIEILQTIKNAADTATIPVIILTTSYAKSDISACYKLHANSYIIKPVGYMEYRQVIERLYNYWVEASTLPSA